MNEDLIAIEESQKKEKIINFYKKYKIAIYIIITVIFFLVVSPFIYKDIKDKKKTELSDRYFAASIHLKNNEKEKAFNTLKEIVLSNDSTYSTLSLFLILDADLIDKKVELIKLYDHVINNLGFDEELKKLVILKKALYASDFYDENEILKILNPIINSKSFWRPHALILLGDYFFYKGDKLKAKQFYNEIILIKNLDKGIYEHVNFQLNKINNE